MNLIQIKIMKFNGRETILPYCHEAKKLADFAGIKAFTPEQIDKLKSLNYQIQRVY